MVFLNLVDLRAWIPQYRVNPSYTGDMLGPQRRQIISGLPNTLLDTGCQQLDRNVKATISRHGNYDYANNAVVWDPNIPDHTIPDSLYLTGEPSWWGSPSCWPPIRVPI